MILNIRSSSIKRRNYQQDQNEHIIKKSKLEAPETLNISTSDDIENLPPNITPTKVKRNDLVSLISYEEKKNVTINVGQIVWSRFNKSPFWPSIVWPTKAGKIKNENEQVLIKHFVNRCETSVWMKLENIFPFDGLESLEKMKQSVNNSSMTSTMKKDFDFAFNISNDLWPRAVAEATFCMTKRENERLALFLMFSVMNENANLLGNIRRSTSRHRFKELQDEKNADTSSNFFLKELKINKELERITSYFKNVRSHDTEETQEFELPDSKISSSFGIFDVKQEISPGTEEIQNIKLPKKTTSSFNEKIRSLRQIEEEFLMCVMESRKNNSLINDIGRKCKICHSKRGIINELVKCSGNCNSYLHRKCLESCFPHHLTGRCLDGEEELKNLLCYDCINQSKPLCFVCKKEDSPQSKTLKCSVNDCSRHYHLNCLKNWPQTIIESNSQIQCPSHECHYCIYDGPKNRNHSFNGTKLTTCIKCPTTLHSSSCIHAGTIILTDKQHICINHRRLARKISNTNYCYVCNKGKSVLSCKTCPLSFHTTCLQLPSTCDQSICTECSNGRHPIYGDIVWARIHGFPWWWPAVIVPPRFIPAKLHNTFHGEHDLCVRFFKKHTFSWTKREFVYRFDDSNSVPYTNIRHNTISYSHYNEAILSAKNWFRKIELIKVNQGHCTDMPYTNIMKNTIVAPAKLVVDMNNEAAVCECNINDKDPCGPTSKCINRVSCIECNDLCPCAAKCRNKCIQQRTTANIELKFMGDKGFGIMSSERIASGTMVIEYIGEIINYLEFQRRMNDANRRNCYIMKYTKEQFIDSELKGNLSRFINHSCNPNCAYETWYVNGVNVVAIVALKDIPKDTEITCQYNWSKTERCLCNESNCTTFM